MTNSGGINQQTADRIDRGGLPGWAVDGGVDRVAARRASGSGGHRHRSAGGVTGAESVLDLNEDWVSTGEVVATESPCSRSHGSHFRYTFSLHFCRVSRHMLTGITLSAGILAADAQRGITEWICSVFLGLAHR